MANSLKVSVHNAAVQIKHNCRAFKEETDSIDYSLSSKNSYYDKNGTEVPVSYNFVSFYRERIADLCKPKKKDYNSLVDWVVSLPKDVKEEEKEKFWTGIREFFKERYNSKNIVGFYIHRDEPGAAEHMHIDFVPAVRQFAKNQDEKNRLYSERDEKIKDIKKIATEENWTLSEMQAEIETAKSECKSAIKNLKLEDTGLEKISCRDVMTQKELKEFHPALQKYMNSYLRRKVGLHTGITKSNGCNKTRNQYKLEEKQREIDTLKKVVTRFYSAALQLAFEKAQSDKSSSTISQKVTDIIFISAKKYAEKAGKLSKEFSTLVPSKMIERVVEREEERFQKSQEKATRQNCNTRI